MDLQLKGKTALVTGSTGGIGYGIGVYGAGCYWNPYGRWICPYY